MCDSTTIVRIFIRSILVRLEKFEQYFAQNQDAIHPRKYATICSSLFCDLVKLETAPTGVLSQGMFGPPSQAAIRLWMDLAKRTIQNLEVSPSEILPEKSTLVKFNESVCALQDECKKWVASDQNGHFVHVNVSQSFGGISSLGSNSPKSIAACSSITPPGFPVEDSFPSVQSNVPPGFTTSHGCVGISSLGSNPPRPIEGFGSSIPPGFSADDIKSTPSMQFNAAPGLPLPDLENGYSEVNGVSASPIYGSLEQQVVESLHVSPPEKLMESPSLNLFAYPLCSDDSWHLCQGGDMKPDLTVTLVDSKRLHSICVQLSELYEEHKESLQLAGPGPKKGDRIVARIFYKDVCIWARGRVTSDLEDIVNIDLVDSAVEGLQVRKSDCFQAMDSMVKIPRAMISRRLHSEMAQEGADEIFHELIQDEHLIMAYRTVKDKTVRLLVVLDAVTKVDFIHHIASSRLAALTMTAPDDFDPDDYTLKKHPKPMKKRQILDHEPKEVYVCFLEDDFSSFYVVLAAEANDYFEFLNEMQTFYSPYLWHDSLKGCSVPYPEVGCYRVAYHFGRFYRVLVTEVHLKEDEGYYDEQFTCFTLDFGRSFTLNSDSLFPMFPQWCERPPAVIHCELNVEPDSRRLLMYQSYLVTFAKFSMVCDAVSLVKRALQLDHLCTVQLKTPDGQDISTLLKDGFSTWDDPVASNPMIEDPPMTEDHPMTEDPLMTEDLSMTENPSVTEDRDATEDEYKEADLRGYACAQTEYADRAVRFGGLNPAEAALMKDLYEDMCPQGAKCPRKYCNLRHQEVTVEDMNFVMNVPPSNPVLFTEYVVKIAHVSSLGKFHVTFPRGFVDRREEDEGQAIRAKYTEMTNSLRQIYGNDMDAYKFIRPPALGAAICVKVKSIDTHAWLRGTVDDVSDGGESGCLLEVFLIDHGVMKSVPLRDCRRWLEICETVPALAVQCAMSGLNCDEENDEQAVLNVKKLTEIAEKYSLVAFVTAIEENGALEVRLYATRGDPISEKRSVGSSDLFFPVFNPETQNIADPFMKE